MPVPSASAHLEKPHEQPARAANGLPIRYLHREPNLWRNSNYDNKSRNRDVLLDEAGALRMAAPPRGRMLVGVNRNPRPSARVHRTPLVRTRQRKRPTVICLPGRKVGVPSPALPRSQRLVRALWWAAQASTVPDGSSVAFCS